MSSPAQHVLLTGGTGFFGLALLRHWAAMGESRPRITILSRSPERFSERQPQLASMVAWVRGDVLDPRSLPRHLRFTHVLHAATDSTLGPSMAPMDRYAQIVDGTRNVLQLALDTGARRFLLTSSGGVYGPQPAHLEKIPETYLGMPDPLNPRNAYSVAKRSAEHLCALFQDRYGLKTVIARCFAFVGPDLPRDVHFAIGNFIRDSLSGEAIHIRGDGSPIRSYMDQRDLARWLVVLLNEGRPAEAYNVGSDVAHSIAEVATKVRDILCPEKSIRIMSIETARGVRDRYVPSTDKVRIELGLVLHHTLEASLRAFKQTLK